MKLLRHVFILIAASLLIACAAPRIQSPAFLPVNSTAKNVEVVVFEKTRTRAGFRDAVTSWLRENGYSYRIVPAGSKIDKNKIVIEYEGHWRWDLATYLQSARIDAFNQEQKFSVFYHVPSTLNLRKFGSADARIRTMLDVLFGRISAKEATRQL